MTQKDEDPLLAAASWISGHQTVAMATVTRTWGSAPRPAGSQMAVREDGAFVGSVSGGCIEGAVIGEAQAALQDGKPRNLKFGVTNEEAWAVGLACGGTIEINVSPVLAPLQRQSLAELKSARDAGRAVALATNLATGESHVVYPDGDAADALTIAARAQARRDESGSVEIEGKNWFLTVF